MPIVIETGPCPHPSAVTNQGLWRIDSEDGPNADKPVNVARDDRAMLMRFLDEIDDGVDPHGGFVERLERAIHLVQTSHHEEALNLEGDLDARDAETRMTAGLRGRYEMAVKLRWED
ncbi:MAG: hypothetical protein JWQ88_2983 [Rhodoferax sp.]|nr:hypothetical protein [Rhodoferax sp.]